MRVMEKPSADHVGCEFVRQYYTMLNRDPKQVHRFYSKDSVFFHGGPTNSISLKPVVGQEEIYKKIEQLKFNDCHAKILQVDSQFTIGGSVVVQVCGEFSNNNEPTKKFVQTFVLAPEGLKKYHVRNDIFRYQEERFSDEVSDETGEGTIDSEGDEDVIDERSLDNKSNNFEKLVNHSEETLSDEEENKISPMTNGSSEIEDEDVAKENGITMDAELEEVVVEKPALIETPPTSYSSESQENTSDVADSTAEEATEEEVVQPFEPQSPDDVEEEPVPEPSGPMSWAAMAGRTPKHGSQNVRPHEPKKPPVVAPSMFPNESPVVQKSQPIQQRMRDSGRATGGTSGVAKDNARLGGRNAPDSHQVFIGNLPNGLEDNQVRDVFSKFGKIVEVRLNPKNFGFVIFDSAKPVELVLKSEPIVVGGQEINIEEKKPSGSLGRGARGGNAGNRGKSGGTGRGGGTTVRAGTAGGKGNGATTPSSGGRGGGGNQRGGGTGGSGTGVSGTGGGNSDGTSGRGRHNRR